jgi:hypothetical protein
MTVHGRLAIGAHELPDIVSERLANRLVSAVEPQPTLGEAGQRDLSEHRANPVVEVERLRRPDVQLALQSCELGQLATNRASSFQSPLQRRLSGRGQSPA